VDEVGDEGGSFFGGAMAYAGEGDEFGVEQVGAKLGRGAKGDGSVAVAPYDESRGLERAAEGAAKASHIVVPGLEQAKQVVDGAGSAKVIAVGLETFGCIPALGAGHAAKADHLNPLGKPGHEVREELAGLGEVEADERVGFVEIRVRGGDEDERANGLAVVRGDAHGDGSAMGVADEDGATEVEVVEDMADLLGCGGEAGVDVGTAFGVAGSGEVEGDDVLTGVKLLHEGDEGFGAPHEAMEEDERGLILRRLSLFEVG
jgi:hypothetical protein